MILGKILSSLGIILLLMQTAIAQQSFSISGKLTDKQAEGGTIFLSYSDGSKLHYDTCTVVKGTFKFQGSIAKPHKAMIFLIYPEALKEIKKGQSNQQLFYLEEGLLKIKGHDIATASLEAGPLQKAYSILWKRLAKVGWKAPFPKDKVSITKRDDVYLQFIKEYSKSKVASDLLTEIGKPNFLSERPAEVREVFTLMPEIWRTSKEGKKVESLLATTDRLGIGKQAIEFVMNDTLGNPVRLSDFRGQYVLLDFWAHWCIPCRAENPNLLKAYEKFKSKNFTVLAVSLDKEADKQKWLDAVKIDGLPWQQLSELKGWDTDVVRNYSIQSIPMNYLIDPTGKIVGVGLRGENLHQKLAEIL